MPPTRINELASIISTKTSVVNDYFEFHGIPMPSFDVNGPQRIVIPPPVRPVAEAHAAILAATRELHQLLLGPSAVLMNMTRRRSIFQPNDMVSLQAIYRYKIASSFPISTEASYSEISSICGLNEVDLRRILRHAMTNSIFREPRAGYVAHTAASRALAEDKSLNDYIGINCEERFPAASRMVDALDKYGMTQDPAQTGFGLSHSTSLGLYDELQKYPDRSRRFANATQAIASRVPLYPMFDGFDWRSLGKATVVDVGGGYGNVAIGLGQRFPGLSLIVQDFPDVVKEGSERLLDSLRGRIEFMAYSILEEQPVKGADVYLFRAVLHNWPDAYIVRILKNQIPALKPGARLVFVEYYAPEPHTKSLMEERAIRNRDLDMLAVFGAPERHGDGWPGLVEQADPRFKVVSTKLAPLGSANAIIEIVWGGEHQSNGPDPS